MNTFAELLKKYRFNNGISQEQLGKKLGVVTMTIHRWEKGFNSPDKNERCRIEEYINDNGTYLDPYELLTHEIRELQKKIDVFKEYLERFHN